MPFNQRAGFKKIERGEKSKTDGAHAQLQLAVDQKERSQRHADQIRRQHGFAFAEIGKTTQRKKQKEDELYLGLAGTAAEPSEQRADDERKHRDYYYGHDREQQQIKIIVGKHQAQRQHGADVVDEAGGEDDLAEFGLVVSGLDHHRI